MHLFSLHLFNLSAHGGGLSGGIGGGSASHRAQVFLHLFFFAFEYLLHLFSLQCHFFNLSAHGGEGDGDAAVRSNGSHCGGQATPRTEGRAFELGWPVAYVSLGSCTTTASAGELRILQYLLMGQALEPKLTISASLLATLGSGTSGLLL